MKKASSDDASAAKSGGRGTRFSVAMDPAAAALNASVAFDRRLLRDDVRGSQAHARMLAAVGLIAPADAEAIVAGLDRGGGGGTRGGRGPRAGGGENHTKMGRRVTGPFCGPGGRPPTPPRRPDHGGSAP